MLQFESQCIKISHCTYLSCPHPHAYHQFNRDINALNLKDAQPCIALKKQLNLPRLQKRFYIFIVKYYT
jgi:hypothetical protein